MGPLLVLVSPWFRENVVVTSKIGSFLCSLDNLLQKNIIVFFFENQISKWCSFEKRAIFDLLSQFLVTRECYKNSFSTYLTHIHTCILLTLLNFFFFFALPILKKNMNLSGMVSQNGDQNISWNVCYWYVFTLMPNLLSFVNLRLWMTEVKTQLNTEITKNTASL